MSCIIQTLIPPLLPRIWLTAQCSIRDSRVAPLNVCMFMRVFTIALSRRLCGLHLSTNSGTRLMRRRLLVRSSVYAAPRPSGSILPMLVRPQSQSKSANELADTRYVQCPRERAP